MSGVVVLNTDNTALHTVSVQHAVRMLVREVAIVEEAHADRRIGPYPWPLVLRLVALGDVPRDEDAADILALELDRADRVLDVAFAGPRGEVPAFSGQGAVDEGGGERQVGGVGAAAEGEGAVAQEGEGEDVDAGREGLRGVASDERRELDRSRR